MKRFYLNDSKAQNDQQGITQYTPKEPIQLGLTTLQERKKPIKVRLFPSKPQVAVIRAKQTV